jgi:site-specific recombinase XerD
MNQISSRIYVVNTPPEEPHPPDRATEFADYLKYQRGYAAKTVSNYTKHVKRFTDWHKQHFPHRSPDRYTLFQWRADTLGGLSPASQHAQLYALRAYFRYLAKRGIVTSDPTADVDMPKLPHKMGYVPSRRDVERILNGPDYSPSGLRDKAILELLYATGARRSELSALNTADVNLTRRVIVIRNGKGGKSRIIPFGEQAMDALIDWLAVRVAVEGEPALFTSMSSRSWGKRLGDRSVAEVVKRYSPDSRTSPHALRRACATHWYECGGGIRYIQEHLGHSSISTTQKYIEASTAKMMEAYKKAFPRA